MRSTLTPASSATLPYDAAASAIDAVPSTSAKYITVAITPVTNPFSARALGNARVATNVTTNGTTMHASGTIALNTTASATIRMNGRVVTIRPTSIRNAATTTRSQRTCESMASVSFD